MKMKYLKRYNKFSFYSNCRICLTQGMIKGTSLKDPLKGPDTPAPLIYEALEYVTKEKVVLSSNYPNLVCGMCLGLLKICYDFVRQYQTSNEEIVKKVGLESNEPAKTDTGAAEIIVGTQKYSVTDLLIVEEEQNEEKPTFEGFLKNLGKTVTATFVDKSHKRKPQMEPPSLIIKKVNSKATPAKHVVSSAPQFLPSDDNNQTSGLIDMENLDEQSKEMVRTALKMKYTCTYCSKPMVSLTRAKIHSQNCQKNNVNLTCYVCKFKFRFRKDLIKHIRTTHLTQLTVDKSAKPTEYKCKICDKTLASSGSYSYHMRKHSGKNYTCDTCGASFYTKSQLENHAQTHSKDKTVVVCPICGKGFHYQSGLYYHMKMHTNERKLQCQYCPRRFYTRNSVKRHELTHTGARPYACQYCDKRFRSLGEVKQHRLLHTGERPYECKYCDSTFLQPYHFKSHLTTHTGDYVCGHCCKGFPEMDILTFHLKTKHSMDKKPIVEEQPAVLQPDLTVVAQEVQFVEQDYGEVEGELILGEGGYYVTEQYEVHEEGDEEEQQVVLASYAIDDEVLVETVEELD